MTTIKKIILLALTALMVGCDNNGKPLGYTYVELDSCEYIAGLYQLAHNRITFFAEAAISFVSKFVSFGIYVEIGLKVSIVQIKNTVDYDNN